MDYERKIKEIENSDAPDAAQRIAYLRADQKRQEEEQASAVKKKRDAAEASFKAVMKCTYMQKNPNASEADFEQDYPALRSEHMRRGTLEADDAARRAVSDAGGRFWVAKRDSLIGYGNGCS